MRIFGASFTTIIDIFYYWLGMVPVDYNYTNNIMMLKSIEEKSMRNNKIGEDL